MGDKNPPHTKYLFSEDDEFCTMLCVDRGYVKHIGQGRGTDLTLERLYERHRASSPHSRYFYPLFAGDPKLLDRELRFTVDNPIPRGNRTKLTCAEANCSRLCTFFRWVIEAVFAAVQAYRIACGMMHPNFLKKIGAAKLPQNAQFASECPKLEIIFNVIFCMVNRNHPGFERNYKDLELPADVTSDQYGEMIYNSLFLENEFDPTQEVVFSENFRLNCLLSLLE